MITVTEEERKARGKECVNWCEGQRECHVDPLCLIIKGSFNTSHICHSVLKLLSEAPSTVITLHYGGCVTHYTTSVLKFVKEPKLSLNGWSDLFSLFLKKIFLIFVFLNVTLSLVFEL